MNKYKTSGQSLVEFALTLPLVLLLVMGVFDLGRGIYYYSTIHNAAREGARVGAIDHCAYTDIRTKVKQKAVGLSLDDSNITIDGPDIASSELDAIKVKVEYTFDFVTPLIGAFFGADGKIQLSSEARQLIEIPRICP